MSDELLVRHCSPTLAGMKTGSVFSCRSTSRSETLAQIRALNRRLVAKGLRVIPLRFTDQNVLVYVYRPGQLQQDLSNEQAARLLLDHGYEDLRAESCLIKLIDRFRESGEFPHELGLFLGYPAVDVKGFINGSECVYTGLWKVYESDLRKARELFERCRDCTKCFLRLNKEGWSLYNLTINK